MFLWQEPEWSYTSFLMSLVYWLPHPPVYFLYLCKFCFIFKCTSHCFLVYSQSCIVITTIHFRPFSSPLPQRNPVLLSYHPLIIPQPLATTNLLSVSISLPILNLCSITTPTSCLSALSFTSCCSPGPKSGGRITVSWAPEVGFPF